MAFNKSCNDHKLQLGNLSVKSFISLCTIAQSQTLKGGEEQTRTVNGSGLHDPQTRTVNGSGG